MKGWSIPWATVLPLDKAFEKLPCYEGRLPRNDPEPDERRLRGKRMALQSASLDHIPQVVGVRLMTRLFSDP